MNKFENDRYRGSIVHIDPRMELDHSELMQSSIAIRKDYHWEITSWNPDSCKSSALTPIKTASFCFSLKKKKKKSLNYSSVHVYCFGPSI